jgi:hypothetical protein
MHRLFLATLIAAAASILTAGPAAAGDMTNHGGRVMTSSATYAIFWLPAGVHFEPTTGNAATDAANDTRYMNFIRRYFQDVGGSGLYETATQYSGSNGAILNSSTFGGSVVDTNAYPKAGTNADPLLNDDLQNEIESVRAAQGWPTGITTEYFIYTGYQVQSCFSSAMTSCSFNAYCAYHYWFNNGDGNRIIWANMPDAFSLGGCGSAQVDSEDQYAHVVLDVTSHEHLEAVTDPEGDAWYDTNLAGENGDKCVREYGTRNDIGANIYMGGNAYQLQREWSNAIHGCATSYTTSSPFIETPAPKLTADLSPATLAGNTSDALVYTLTVTDPSNNEPVKNAVITTTLPSGLTRTGGGTLVLNVGTLGVHDSRTYTINVSPSSNLLDGTVLNVSSSLASTDQLGNALTAVTASDSATVVNAQPTLSLPGDQSQDYHDALTFGISASDVNLGDSIALSASGLPSGLTFTDNGDRTGTVSGTITALPAPYVVTFYADDHHHLTQISGTLTINVLKEETTTTYNGPTVILKGASGVTLKAQLLEDGTTAPVPSGQSIKLSLGTQFCFGTADATGTASCTLTFSGTLGNQPLKAEFAGDAYYQASSDTGKTAVVFSFPSRGAFVLGNTTVAAATPATTVAWWSDNWWSLNSLTGGTAPLSFKGFAGVVTTLPNTSPANVCGTTFTTGPGNSPPPSSGVPTYMGVVVADSVTKSGNVINGHWGKIVVVKIDPGYAPTPGHPGTGKIVGTFC